MILKHTFAQNNLFHYFKGVDSRKLLDLICPTLEQRLICHVLPRHKYDKNYKFYKFHLNTSKFRQEMTDEDIRCLIIEAFWEPSYIYQATYKDLFENDIGWWIVKRCDIYIAN